MSATTANGRPARKQLCDQLDRLDGIIDALAEGLNQAVADACREGTRAAVRDVLIELATNPELRAMFTSLGAAPAPAPTLQAPPAPQGPGVWTRLKAKLATVREAAARAATAAKEAVIRRCVVAGEAVVALGRMTGETLPVRRMALVGLGLGLVVGVTCLLVPQTTAAVVSGAGAACTSVAVQTGQWLTRAARRVGLLS
jgi:hypothetical protein